MRGSVVSMNQNYGTRPNLSNSFGCVQDDWAFLMGYVPTMPNSHDELVRLLDAYMHDNKSNLRKIAALAGLNYDTVHSIYVGKSKNPKHDTLRKLMPLLGGDQPAIRQIPVVGHAGAGDSVLNFDDHPKGHGLEEVDCPPGADADKVVAVRVKGDSMLPVYEDGDVLYFTRERDGVPTNCLNKTCIVKLADDGVLVKKVTRGSKPGHFHLISKNPAVPPMVDIPILWASRVIFVKPE